MNRINKNIDLSGLYDIANNDSAFIKDMIHTYLEEVPAYLNNLKVSIEKMDLEKVSFFLHKSKSPIALMGVLKAQLKIDEMESQLTGENPSKTQLLDLFNELYKHCEIANKQLAKLVSNLN